MSLNICFVVPKSILSEDNTDTFSYKILSSVLIVKYFIKKFKTVEIFSESSLFSVHGLYLYSSKQLPYFYEPSCHLHILFTDVSKLPPK